MIKHKRNGFTIIELLIVIVVIGILSSLVLNTFRGTRTKAEASIMANEIRELDKAILAYLTDTGQFPEHIGATATTPNPLLVNHNSVSGWNGPYLTDDFTEHRYGGDYFNYTAFSGDYRIGFDDDSPGSGASNPNDGPVPNDVLLEIDEIIDDGNLSTGSFILLVPGEGALLKTRTIF